MLLPVCGLYLTYRSDEQVGRGERVTSGVMNSVEVGVIEEV